jgi:hypothetical protein
MNFRRLGRFAIPSGMIRLKPNEVVAALAGCIIVRAELAWASNNIEYIAICDEFDVTPEGSEPPRYDVVLHTDPDGSVKRESFRRTPTPGS